MLGQPGKGEIRLKCTEPAFAEFKELLFGTDPETGISYFDATSYLQEKKHPVSLQQFFVQWRTQIGMLCNAYKIDPKKVYLINEQGHYLIEANFVCLFISFVEPGFLAYMCDRTYELFTQGVSVSDTYLLQQAHSRLPSEILKTIIEDETSSV